MIETNVWVNVWAKWVNRLLSIENVWGSIERLSPNVWLNWGWAEIAADIDPLRSEGQAYAQRLRTEGTTVRATNYTNVTHEFFGMGAVVNKAKQAVQQAAAGLRSSFNRQGKITWAK